MATEFLPIEHFQETDDDYSTVRIRDMPYGKHREAVTLYPSGLDFGNVLLDRVSIAETILLTNVGYDNVSILEIIVVGDFVNDSNIITEIKPEEIIELKVAFCPKQEGLVTGGLYIDAPTAVGRKFISFSGSGVSGEEIHMQYVLIQGKATTGGAVSISSGVYSFIVTGDFAGASIQLQWRLDGANSWLDIPGTMMTAVNTIYGIPLNLGQARVVINDSESGGTSLTAKLAW